MLTIYIVTVPVYLNIYKDIAAKSVNFDPSTTSIVWPYKGVVHYYLW
jgi:hypothetical protein